jgi:hypothetical protein
MMGKGFSLGDLDNIKLEPKLKMATDKTSKIIKEIKDAIAEGTKEAIGKKPVWMGNIKNGGGLSIDDIVAAQPMTQYSSLQVGEMTLSQDGTSYIIPIKFKPPFVLDNIQLQLLCQKTEQLEFPFVTELRV